jgi:hypothetical protein
MSSLVPSPPEQGQLVSVCSRQWIVNDVRPSTLPANRVFSPQNWIKTKTCLAGIRAAIQQYFTRLPARPGGKELSQKLRVALTMDPGQFEARWAAD